MKKTAALLLLCTLLCVVACGQKNEPQKETFTDPRDNKIYKTVKIGEQVWMAENLNYAVLGSKCYGGGGKVKDENDSLITLSSAEIQANCDKYGRLYNWKTAMTVCPSGWHLPDSSEWRILTAAAGGKKRAGKNLKTTSGWKDYKGVSGNGDDKFGFSALPGGAFFNSVNFFDKIGSNGYWWSANKHHLVYAWEHNYSDFKCSNVIVQLVMLLWSFFSCDLALSWGTDYSSGYFDEGGGSMNDLLNIRCLQNATSPQEPPNDTTFVQQIGTFTDTRDGKTYKTTKIGEQVWMGENLNYEAEGSKCYNDSTAYCSKYGRLYNWETAMKACPNGWHLPDTTEWQVLDEAVGSEDTADKYLKATSGWYIENNSNGNGNGNDKYGFSALPGGFRGSSGGFGDVGYRGYWWISNEYGKGGAYQRLIYPWYNNAHYYESSTNHFLSVRCLQNTPASPKGSAK